MSQSVNKKFTKHYCVTRTRLLKPTAIKTRRTQRNAANLGRKNIMVLEISTVPLNCSKMKVFTSNFTLVDENVSTERKFSDNFPAVQN